jgi:hypothetical protein
MKTAREALLAQIDDMEKRLAGESDDEISAWAEEIVEEEAKVLQESTGIPVRNKMDFSDQNTKMSSVADTLVKLAKSLMGEESEGDKQVDQQYEEEVKNEDEIIGASENKVASALVKLAAALLAEEEGEEEGEAEKGKKAEEKKDVPAEEPKAKKAAEEKPAEDKKAEGEKDEKACKAAEINKLEKVIAYAQKKLAALKQ